MRTSTPLKCIRCDILLPHIKDIPYEGYDHSLCPDCNALRFVMQKEKKKESISKDELKALPKFLKFNEDSDSELKALRWFLIAMEEHGAIADSKNEFNKIVSRQAKGVNHTKVSRVYDLLEICTDEELTLLFDKISGAHS